MTIVRVGSTEKYAEGWAKAFSKGRQTSKKQLAKKTTRKKSAKNSSRR